MGGTQVTDLHSHGWPNKRLNPHRTYWFGLTSINLTLKACPQDWQGASCDLMPQVWTCSREEGNPGQGATHLQEVGKLIQALAYIYIYFSDYCAYRVPGTKSTHTSTLMCARMFSQTQLRACMCSTTCMCAHMSSKTCMSAHMGACMCSQSIGVCITSRPLYPTSLKNFRKGERRQSLKLCKLYFLSPFQKFFLDWQDRVVDWSCRKPWNCWHKALLSRIERGFQLKKDS